MRSKIKMNMFLVVLVAIFSASGASAAGIGNNIVVLLAGEGLADASGNQFTELGLVAPPGVLCFDIDLVDAKTGNVIGRGSDCLSDITPSDNGGMSLTATSFFHFPGGTLVSRGLVTVQPKLHGLEEYTHVVGAAPSLAENSVIYGDGKFKDAAGSVRLSGLVNLSRLGSGYIDFDCIFVIDL
ncbi:MAG: hypothetical protein GWP62_12305 [Gammaproteobacteria bacterium]|jgi:hypothetical protein|nr:hypothetical protein [Gammaproteobacteria bacterium]